MLTKTKYVKVKMKLLTYNEETDDEEKIVITRKKFNNLSVLGKYLTQHILYNTIDVDSYHYSGVLSQEDLMWYVTEEYDHLGPKVKSIVPMFLEIEDPIPNDEEHAVEWYKNFKTRELDVYLYIKVDITDDLNEEELHNLLDYCQGQMTDGWGEGFEQKDHVYSEYCKGDDGNYKKVSFRFHLSYDYPEPLQFVDKIERTGY